MSRRIAPLWIALVLAVAAFGGLIAPHDPYKTGLGSPSQPPGEFLLGTDTLGRDLFSRVLSGGILTLIAGVSAAALAWTIGGILGAAGALNSRWLCGTSQLLTNALLALPSFLIALIVVTGLGANLPSTAIAAGVAQAGIASQVWRGAIDHVLREPYIAGADALGAARLGILRRHVLPNIMPILGAYACMLFASSVLMISGLSFLGLTGEPASPDWGNILAEGRVAIRYAPWIMLAPAIALMAVTNALNSAARLLNQRGSPSRPPLPDLPARPAARPASSRR